MREALSASPLLPRALSPRQAHKQNNASTKKEEGYLRGVA